MHRTLMALLASMALVAVTLGPGAPAVAAAAPPGAVVASGRCHENALPRNDDNSSSAVPLPFDINFYGQTFGGLWVNNNGNVTFDGPLPTYTPFGLLGTSTRIIAPFFADVDTRTEDGGLVAYGWGDTLFEGHRAFCVDWLDVGYFDRHTDKRNTFQLLLVEREDSAPGDFDVVFNYGGVQWESGDLSGGSGGLGGTTARAGFSNGVPGPDTTYELPGSGVPGALLDGGSYALATTTTNSTTAGRHVFAVRAGGAPATQYVALGDSFQSGEGSFEYRTGTDTGDNQCHRSVSAYPVLVSQSGLAPSDLRFWACSGAVVEDQYLSSPSSDAVPWNDPIRGEDDGAAGAWTGQGAGVSYLSRLSASTKLVTIGIGGNDVDFAGVLEGCITDGLADSFIPFHDSSCEGEYDTTVRASLAEVVDGQKWSNLFTRIREKAPYARVVVLGYPRFFTRDGANNGLSARFCGGFRIGDQRWINSRVRDVNAAIRSAALGAGLDYADVYDAPQGHELCGASRETFLNGIFLQAGSPAVKNESYHPTEYGHEVMAGVVEGVLQGPSPGRSSLVRPRQTVSLSQQVLAGTTVSFNTSWPGSDVVTTLRSPSGRTIGRGAVAADVVHEVGPTYERYAVTDPEPGEWTVELYGERVAPQGEETLLSVHQDPVANIPPVAAITVEQSGRTVTVDGSGSTDPDGTVQDHLWEFGDGSVATGPRATHTYDQPGDFLVTLAVRDDDGGEGFAASSGVLTVPRSAFRLAGRPSCPPAIRPRSASTAEQPSGRPYCTTDVGGGRQAPR